MIRLQRRTFDVAKRREILDDIRRYLAEQVYYHYHQSVTTVSAWEPYVKNFAPNIGHEPRRASHGRLDRQGRRPGSPPVTGMRPPGSGGKT